MKLKQEFVLRDIAGDSVLIPVTSRNDEFQGIITLNETGVFIWKRIEEGKEREEIVADLLAEYNVEEEHAVRSVDNFCNHLNELGIL